VKLAANINQDICLVFLFNADVLSLIVGYDWKVTAREANRRSKLFIMQEVV
jgi:hypothetical protein